MLNRFRDKRRKEQGLRRQQASRPMSPDANMMAIQSQVLINQTINSGDDYGYKSSGVGGCDSSSYSSSDFGNSYGSGFDSGSSGSCDSGSW